MHGCESPSPSLVVDPLGGSMPLHRQLYQKLGPAQAGPPSRSFIERLRERVGFSDEVSSTSGRHVTQCITSTGWCYTHGEWFPSESGPCPGHVTFT
jgi:hypothetical protein